MNNNISSSNAGNPSSPSNRPQQFIRPLSDGKEYRLWLARVKSRLQELNLWNDKAQAPFDSQEASNFLLSVLSDNILELFLDTDFAASVIWTTLASKFLVHSLSAQSTAFTALVNFNYSEVSMADNKLALLSLARNLRTSFKDHKSIDIDDLVMLFALINVPSAYHHLRSTLEETNKTGLKLESLFESLEREESLSVSSGARRAALAATASASAGRQDSSSSKCAHRRPAATCWTCHPHLRPTCSECQAKGLLKYYHVKGSKFCKEQQAKPAAAVPVQA
jgi:hypothetical protein